MDSKRENEGPDNPTFHVSRFIWKSFTSANIVVVARLRHERTRVIKMVM